MTLSDLAGNAVDWLGWPGIVRRSDYRASIANVTVRVRTSPRFTVITVNGIDVYFERLTGRIDGVGSSPVVDYSLSGRIR